MGVPDDGPLKLLRWAAGALLLLATAATAAFLATSNGGASLGALSFFDEEARFRQSPAWCGEHFCNPGSNQVMKPSLAFQALVETFLGDQERTPRARLPLFTGAATILRAPPAQGLRLTWFGHSSVLIEIDGFRILTDPQWSERASPSTLIGPKRFHPPPVALEDLGRLDAVLISHDHYDHLDMETVKKLAATGVRFWVPLGIGAHLRAWKVPDSQIREMDWGSEADPSPGLRLVSVPAQHFSGRGLATNPTLWTSWVINGPNHRVFFSGDTGPHGGFSQIADRFGPFDVALVEIGQYHPSWGDIHLGPRGAWQAFSELRARELLPIHWGTFELALHGWSEPAEQLFQLAGPSSDRILTPLLGEPVEPETWIPRPPWWRAVD